MTESSSRPENVLKYVGVASVLFQVFFTSSLNSLPTKNPELSLSETLDFLKQFESEADFTGSIRSETNFHTAKSKYQRKITRMSPKSVRSGADAKNQLNKYVRDYQKFYNTTEKSGNLDTETKELFMFKGPCGNKDNIKNPTMRRNWKTYKNLNSGENTGENVGKNPAKTKINWSVSTDMKKILESTIGIEYKSMKSEILKGLCIWSQYANIDFHEVSSNADINFKFGNSNVKTHDETVTSIYDTNFKPTTIAHGFPPPRTTQEYQADTIFGDIHINLDQNWQITEDISAEGDVYKHISLHKQIDQGIAFTLAHEIGHSLGLFHSGNPRSLMFNKRTRLARWNENRPELGFGGDKDEIVGLYGARGVGAGGLSDECKVALGLGGVVDDFDAFSDDSDYFEGSDDSADSDDTDDSENFDDPVFQTPEDDSIAVKNSRWLLETEKTVLASSTPKKPEQKCDFELATPTCWCEFNGEKSSAVKVYHQFLLDLRPLNCDVKLFQ